MNEEKSPLPTNPEQPVKQDIEPSAQSEEIFSLTAHEHFVGPLPPPEVLAEYERVVPGLAERIVALAEKEQHERFALAKERVSLEREDIAVAKEQISLLKRAQWFGFSFGTATLASSLYLITHGEPAGSVATLITGIATLLGTFFYGNKR